MKILFADKFPEAQLQQLQDQSHECDLQPDLDGDTLPQAVNDAEVLVVRSTKITSDTIGAAASLRLIIRAGAGTNTIDKDAAADRGYSGLQYTGEECSRRRRTGHGSADRY